MGYTHTHIHIYYYFSFLFFVIVFALLLWSIVLRLLRKWIQVDGNILYVAIVIPGIINGYYNVSSDVVFCNDFKTIWQNYREREKR